MGAEAPGVHDPLGDALVVEVEDLLAEVEVVEQRRAALAGAQRVLVVGDRDALLGGQRHAGAGGRLVGLAAGADLVDQRRRRLLERPAGPVAPSPHAGFDARLAGAAAWRHSSWRAASWRAAWRPWRSWLFVDTGLAGARPGWGMRSLPVRATVEYSSCDRPAHCRAGNVWISAQFSPGADEERSQIGSSTP